MNQKLLRPCPLPRLPAGCILAPDAGRRGRWWHDDGRLERSPALLGDVDTHQVRHGIINGGVVLGDHLAQDREGGEMSGGEGKGKR